MSDPMTLKRFLVKLSRVLSESEKQSFMRQIREYSETIRVLIPSDLYLRDSFLEYISFAYKHEMINPENTNFLFQMLDGCEDPNLTQELLDLGNNFDSGDVFEPASEIIHSPSKEPPVSEKVLFRSISQSCSGVRMRENSTKKCGDSRRKSYVCPGSTLLSDSEVLRYSAQIPPSHWKEFAVLGLKISLTEVERIDYDCRTLQDKLLRVFSYWKNESFDSCECPSFCKEGLKQALAAAKLNNLIVLFKL